MEFLIKTSKVKCSYSWKEYRIIDEGRILMTNSGARLPLGNSSIATNNYLIAISSDLILYVWENFKEGTIRSFNLAADWRFAKGIKVSLEDAIERNGGILMIKASSLERSVIMEMVFDRRELKIYDTYSWFSNFSWDGIFSDVEGQDIFTPWGQYKNYHISAPWSFIENGIRPNVSVGKLSFFVSDDHLKIYDCEKKYILWEIKNFKFRGISNGLVYGETEAGERKVFDYLTGKCLLQYSPNKQGSKIQALTISNDYSYYILWESKA